MNGPFQRMQAALLVLAWLALPGLCAAQGPDRVPPLHGHELQLEGEPENDDSVRLVAGQAEQVTPLPQTSQPTAKPQAKDETEAKRRYQPMLPARRILPDYAYITPRIDADHMPGHWMPPDPGCGAAG